MTTAQNLIALGFDGFGDPHIMTVSGAGVCSEQFGVGWCVIGAGEPLAHGYLQAHQTFHLSPNLAEVCYHMHAAKFTAENSPYVGKKQTITNVFHFDGGLSANYGADESRRYYDALAAQAIPEETLKGIAASLEGGWVYPV